MRLLVMDTTGPACSVALRVPGQADLVCSEAMARGQAERLAPMVAEVLAKAGLTPRDLERIGVTTGPGSFAGTRVGVAFARGLALATGADVVGISNLEWWAFEAHSEGLSTVLAVHDAKRGEFVVQRFEDGVPQTPPLLMIEEKAKNYALEALESGRPVSAMIMTGTGARLLFPVPREDADFQPDLTRLLSFAEQAEAPFHPPKPFYARPPDAKLPGGVSLT